MPYTPNTTWVDGPGGGTPISAARLNNLESGVTLTFEAFTPVWTSSGTAPSIGNGTATGKYMKRGRFVYYSAVIGFGTTSSFGTGVYSFSLPADCVGSPFRAAGQGWLFDSNTANIAHPIVQLATATTLTLEYPATYLGARTEVAATAPWTWAQGDGIQWWVIYESAS